MDTAAATASSSDSDCGHAPHGGFSSWRDAKKAQKRAARAVQHLKFVETTADNKALRAELRDIKKLQADLHAPCSTSIAHRTEAQRKSLVLHAADAHALGHSPHYASTAAVATSSNQPYLRQITLEVHRAAAKARHDDLASAHDDFASTVDSEPTMFRMDSGDSIELEYEHLERNVTVHEDAAAWGFV